MATENETLEQVSASDKMVNSLFSDELYSAPKVELGISVADKIEVPAAEVKPEQDLEITPEPTKETPAPTETKVPEFDVNKFIKDEYGFDSKEVAKEQIEKWRKAEKEPKPKAEPEKPSFANTESETLYNAFITGDKKKVTEILRKQEEIENVAELSPVEQIKLDLKFRNPKYTKDDIQDVIEEKYSYPNQPVQRDDELDSEFQSRAEAHKKEVAKIDRRISRDGLEAVENLQKHKTDLVLPDINGSRADYDKWVQQQKDLQAEDAKAHKSYLTALENSSKFEGFKTMYKDKEVEVPIEYKSTDEEDKQLINRFKEGFDADEFFAKRWIKEENNKVVGFNVSQQKQDVYVLENFQKIIDKVAQDSATKALTAYWEKEKNIKFKSPNDRVNGEDALKSLDDKLTTKLFPD